MRTCENCYNGHFRIKNKIEEMYCDIDKNYEKIVENDSYCLRHRYFGGCEEEKNYVLYDEKYLGPGYFIYNEDKNGIIKFFKIYIMNNYGFPTYGLRAFSINAKDNPNQEFNNIEFTFRDQEDYKNGLFQLFTNFNNHLFGNYIETIDAFNHGRNNFTLNSNGYVAKITISKDIYGVRENTDFIDINIGDYITCKNYEAIHTFYKTLSTLYPPTPDEDIEKLLSLTNCRKH